MSNAAPGFAKHPNHTVTITPADGSIIVMVNGKKIGETQSALKLTEANYPLAYYLPLETVPAEYLTKSEHTAYCPFKGTASYYHLEIDGHTHENAVWTYREPYDEVTSIKNHIAIYPNVASVGPA